MNREQGGTEQTAAPAKGAAKGRVAWGHWLMLGVTALLFVLVAAFVDLKPQVQENFFFSSNDPQFQEQKKIDKIFPSHSQMIVSVTGKIGSEAYMRKLGELTRDLDRMKSVTGVESLTDGPKDLKDAEESPFWKRLLLADNGRSSNVVVFATGKDNQQLIEAMEAETRKLESADFRMEMAGAPYVAEMMRRSLVHDFHTFSLTSVLLFGVAMWVLFRSWKITLGMLATCTSAVLAALMVQSMFGEKIGILTANLGTIVFVVTLSHLVYMTFNWQTLARRGDAGEGPELAGKAWRMTLPASSWSMVCASLGFGSLLFVPAKPLRELGVGGTAGTVLALVAAYLMFPAFLAWESANKTKVPEEGAGDRFWQRKFVWVAVATVVASSGLAIGMTRLDTDPSLLEYFKKDRQPRQGLEYVDRNGGVNPMTIVVQARDGGKLDDKDEYQKLWDLQDALQDHKGVGTVLSEPVLLEEAHRHPLAFLFTENHLLNILNDPKHHRVASTFITKDRTMAAFYLRMEEHGRSGSRVDLVRQLRGVVRKEGFRTSLVGGVYYLQGELAQLTAKSLVEGLSWLFVFFTVVALIVGRNLRIAAAMIFSLALVPACMLGGVGLLGVPVDIISAPATNVCIGMAIDSMVHLVFAVRRAKKDGKEGWAAWVEGRREQWRGIVFSDVVIGAGFAIFALSNFPPTQRFGLVVLAGTAIDILANLFVLPLLGGAEWRRVGSAAGQKEAATAGA